MDRRVSPVCGFAISILAVTLMGASAVPQLAAPPGSATILNRGADDYTGFRIVIRPDGRAAAVDATGRSSSDLNSDLSDRFFTDLRSAERAVKTSGAHCASDAPLAMDSAAVNADVSISWNGRRWADLRCASESSLVALRDDATAIEHALYVQAYRERPLYVYLAGRYAPGQGGQVYGQGYQTPAAVGGYSGQAFSSTGYGSSPYSGMPSGTLPTSNLPVSGLSGGLPTGSLPYSSPYTGLPTSGLSGGLPGTSPYSGSPYSGI